jgi:transcriptional antiterminator RfaH
MSELWYALRVKPHKEKLVYHLLLAQDAQVYYPYYRVKPKNPRAAKERPYFPGYMFVHADLVQVGLHAYDWVPGAYGLVTFGGIPSVVPVALIQQLEKQLREMKEADLARRQFKPGETVRITEGPFAGYEAIFDLYLPGDERVQVLLAFLSHYPQPVQLDVTNVEK